MFLTDAHPIDKKFGLYSPIQCEVRPFDLPYTENNSEKLWFEVFPSPTKAPRVDVKLVKNIAKQFLDALSSKEWSDEKLKTALVLNFISVCKIVLTYSPSNVLVSITNSDSLLIRSEKNSNNIYFETFIDPKNLYLSNCVINIFKNKQQQLSVSGNISEIKAELDEYFNPIATPFPSTYSLSKNTFTTTIF